MTDHMDTICASGQAWLPSPGGCPPYVLMGGNLALPGFGTKAENLCRLGARGFLVPPLVYFTVDQWRKAPGALEDMILTALGPYGGKVAVRSSALAEDGPDKSMAGAFTSVLDVDPHAPGELVRAVERVITSYGGHALDQVLVQLMATDIRVSGVIMTRNLDDGSPYYVITYDDESGRTDTCTAGNAVTKTVYVFKGVRREHFDSERLFRILRFARQVEAAVGGLPVDIEFGLDGQGRFHLFQVRRICTASGWNLGVERGVSGVIRQVEGFAAEFLGPRPGMLGARTILGNMPDWNPAEIIGAAPRPLAASLYREIITRRAWSLARQDMGYMPVGPADLMVLVAGRPYIDVRLSFNSFLPAGMDKDAGTRLVEAWLDRLDQHPELHDKVEFEVAQTVLDFGFDAVHRERYSGVLAAKEFDEYREALARLTGRALEIGPKGTLYGAMAAVRGLESCQAARVPLDPDTATPMGLLGRVAALLEECQEQGTRPFSIVARHAFIAEAFLRSAVDRGALSPERVQAYKKSVATVSGRLTRDFRAVCAGTMAKAQFMKNYGHLRPGTYDILSPSYAARPDLFDKALLPAIQPSPESFIPTAEELRDLAGLFRESGLGISEPRVLFQYGSLAIAGREEAKFIFTRSLSEAIETLAAWGAKLGLSREDVSLLDLQDIISSARRSPRGEPRRHFAKLAGKGREAYDLSRFIKLSYLIRSARDIYIVPVHRNVPNFITSGRVRGVVAYLDAEVARTCELHNRIALIENADPGYDWIFTRGIAGLITKYGGANSHMAIRCAEYGLPAAIGCGELLFKRVLEAGWCDLNCGERILRVERH